MSSGTTALHFDAHAVPHSGQDVMSRNGAVDKDATSTNPGLDGGDIGFPHRRRRWPWLIVGAGVGVAATLGVQNRTTSDAEGAAATPTEVVELAAAEVTSTDFIDYVEYAGELSRGELRSVLATSSGTVTASVAVGAALERGAVVASIDAVPVVAFYGSEPFYRDLVSGDVGSDVLQLESNLWALGFTDDGTLSVDGRFDSSTTDALEEWEASLGLDASGDFDAGRVVVLDGQSVVSEIAAPGASVSAGQELMLSQTIESILDVRLNASGLEEDVVIDNVVAAGTPIEHGTVLLTLDGLNVFALTEVSVVTSTILTAFEEDDIEQLENLLVFFGFDPDAAIVADDDADLATMAGVSRWQESIGLAGIGELGGPYYVVVPSGFEVVEAVSQAGDPLGLGALAMTLATSRTSVSASIVVDEIDDIDAGDAVEVVLADGRILAGSVQSISDVADQAADGSVPTVVVDIAVDGAPEDVIVGPVTVRLETNRISNATVVPTRALISLSEGGFAVEVRSADGRTRLVAVELGAFDDGLVEVLRGDVAPGDTVVVPT